MIEEDLLMSDNRPEVVMLLNNIKKSLSLLKQMSLDSDEDRIYRFYHQSFKVYSLQEKTKKIVKILRSLLPGQYLNNWFLQIVKEGTGKKFKMKDNQNWLKITRPILEAYFHAKFFLEVAVKSGDMKYPPALMPSGWAALLYLYNLR